MHSAAKSELRRSVLAARARLTPAARAAAETGVARALAPLLAGAARVAAYVSFGTEPSTRALLRPGWLLPVLLPDGDLDWAAYDGTLGPVGTRGILQPTGPLLGPDTVGTCDLVLVPALAVDLTGRRLGRGGGSYDRALARTTGRTVALLHAGELREQVPTEPHDRPVAAAALPDRGIVPLRE